HPAPELSEAALPDRRRRRRPERAARGVEKPRDRPGPALRPPAAAWRAQRLSPLEPAAGRRPGRRGAGGPDARDAGVPRLRPRRAASGKGPIQRRSRRRRTRIRQGAGGTPRASASPLPPGPRAVLRERRWAVRPAEQADRPAPAERAAVSALGRRKG